MDYSKKTRSELIEICKGLNIKGISNKNKDDLINLIQENENKNLVPTKRKKPKVAPTEFPINTIINNNSKITLKTFPDECISFVALKC